MPQTLSLEDDNAELQALISVGMARIVVSNLNYFRLNDLYQNAPDPPQPEDRGLRLCNANLLYLHETLRLANWHDPSQRLLEARTSRFLTQMRREEPGEYEARFPFKTTPKDYQLKIFCYARRMKWIALSPAALGTGKTKMGWDIAAAKFLENEIDCLAIVAPAGVHIQWITDAMPVHLSDAVTRASRIWKSTRKTPEIVLRQPNGRLLRILSFNVEGFSRKNSKAEKALKAFLRSGRGMMIVDESTRIKNYGAERTRNIVRIGSEAVVKMILTGTPMTKGLEDIFSQYGFLDFGIIGLPTQQAFRHRYCIEQAATGRRAESLGVRRITGYKNQEELIRRIAPYSFMIPKDVLGLPKQRWERRYVPMTPEQEALYVALRDRLVEDLREKRVKTPQNAAVRLLRLQQVLCGRYVEEVPGLDEDDDPIQTVRTLPNNRPQILFDALEDHDGQAVIWACFREDIDDVAAKLRTEGRTYVTYDGRVKQSQRSPAVQAFRNGDVQYFVANQAAGGTGVDGLQVASLACYYSTSFNAEHRWQSEGRTHRIGTEGFMFPGEEALSVLYLDFVCRNTVDVFKLKSLRKKEELARAILADPTMLLGGVEEPEEDWET